VAGILRDRCKRVCCDPPRFYWHLLFDNLHFYCIINGNCRYNLTQQFDNIISLVYKLQCITYEEQWWKTPGHIMTTVTRKKLEKNTSKTWQSINFRSNCPFATTCLAINHHLTLTEAACVAVAHSVVQHLSHHFHKMWPNDTFACKGVDCPHYITCCIYCIVGLSMAGIV